MMKQFDNSKPKRKIKKKKKTPKATEKQQFNPVLNTDVNISQTSQEVNMHNAFKKKLKTQDKFSGKHKDSLQLQSVLTNSCVVFLS